jgi:hypothetical protein
MIRSPRLALIILGALALFGCGVGDSLQGGIYRHGVVAFKVDPVPREWRRVSLGGATLAFRDDAREGSVLINARCNLAGDAPLLALTTQLLIGTTHRELIAEDTIPFDGREALHSHLRAKLDGVEMEYGIYVLKKDGCVYDFVYVAPPSTFDDGAALFDRFVAGFHTVAPSTSAP